MEVFRKESRGDGVVGCHMYSCHDGCEGCVFRSNLDGELQGGSYRAHEDSGDGQEAMESIDIRYVLAMKVGGMCV